MLLAAGDASFPPPPPIATAPRPSAPAAPAIPSRPPPKFVTVCVAAPADSPPPVTDEGASNV